jgi:hypothetical protein
MLYYNNFTPTNSMERRERELASIELDPVVFLEAMSKPADSEPQTAKARHIMRHGCCILKLRVSALRLFTCGETLGFITTRSVSEGFTANLRKTQKHDPSLTQRVGMTTNAQLQNARMTVCPESDLHHRSKRRCDRPNTAICCQILFQ